jgi:TOBE domain
MLRPEKLELGSLHENKISGKLLDSSFTGQNLSLRVETALGTLMLSKVGSFETLADALELSFSATDALILPEVL